jgi:MYXO-CTERM domain-containing protein
MHRSIAASALVLLTSAGAFAAEWHPAVGSARHPGSARQVAALHLAAMRSPLALDGVELDEREVLASGRYRTVRYQQEHAGLPVLGRQAVVRVSPAGRASVTVLEVARGLSLSPVAGISEAQARALVAAQRGGALPRARVDLAVLPTTERGLLVWQVDVVGGDGGRRYLVDAQAGVVLSERRLAVHALGRVYPVSSVSTPATEDVELLDLVPSSPQLLTGWDGNLIITNYVAGGSMTEFVVEQTLQPNQGADFLYDPPVDTTDPTDGFAQVGIYYHLTRMRTFVETTLGVDTSAPSWKLGAVANVREEGAPLDNAFFSPMGLGAPWSTPNMIGIGQGSTFDFAQDSDVFNHEYTHYLTHNAVEYNAGQLHFDDYGLSPFSAAIDEGLSDYFACTVNDDPILGEASLALLSAARDLTDTSKRCPDEMFGEPHADGEIIGSFAWTLRESLGAAVADELVWGATTLLTFGASFGDFGRGIQQTADEMVTDGKLSARQRQTIDDALGARGLTECDPELPLRPGEPRTSFLIGFDLVAQFFGGTCESVKDFGLLLHSMFHYVVTPEPDSEGIAIRASLIPEGSGQLSWGLYGRAQQHVTFASSSGFFPELSDYDHAVEGISTTSGELVIDASSDPPFDPSATYHVVLVHQNCPTAEALIELDEPGPPTGAGGSGGSASSGAGGVGGGDGPAPLPPVEVEGCGCRTGAAPSQGAAWLLLLGLGWALRRRRR